MALLGPAIVALTALLHTRDPSLAQPTRPPPLAWPALQTALLLAYRSPNHLKLRSVAETAHLLALFRALRDVSDQQDREAFEWVCGIRAAVLFDRPPPLGVGFKLPPSLQALVLDATLVAEPPLSPNGAPSRQADALTRPAAPTPAPFVPTKRRPKSSQPSKEFLVSDDDTDDGPPVAGPSSVIVSSSTPARHTSSPQTTISSPHTSPPFSMSKNLYGSRPAAPPTRDRILGKASPSPKPSEETSHRLRKSLSAASSSSSGSSQASTAPSSCPSSPPPSTHLLKLASASAPALRPTPRPQPLYLRASTPLTPFGPLTRRPRPPPPEFSDTSSEEESELLGVSTRRGARAPAPKQRRKRARSGRLGPERVVDLREKGSHPMEKAMPPTVGEENVGEVIEGARAAGRAGERNEDVERSDGESVEGELYCVCDYTSYGIMVACDSGSCPLEWFHLPCTTLVAVPAPGDVWICDGCKSAAVGESMGLEAVRQRWRAFLPVGHSLRR